MKGLTNEEFVKRAKTKHGNKYDYSKVVYEGMSILGSFIKTYAPLALEDPRGTPA